MPQSEPIQFPLDFEDPPQPPRCLRCGYFLEGLIEPRCPECGTAFDPLDSSTYTRHPGYLFWKYWLPGFVQALIGGGIICYLFLVNRQVGWGLSLAAPFSIGAILGYGVRSSVQGVVVLAMSAIVFVVGTMVFLDVAGPLCGAILTILFFVPTAMGVACGIILRRLLKLSSFDQRFYFPVLLFLVLPAVVHGIERWAGGSNAAESLITSRTIAASVRHAWEAKIFTAAGRPTAGRPRGRHPVPEPYPALPAPRPLEMEGEHSVPGGVKRVTFNRGKLAVEITDRQAERLVAFRFVGQNHLEDRAVKLLDGRMEFEPDSPTRTRVTLSTRYQPLMTPRWYWRPFERMTGEKVHAQIINELERSTTRPVGDAPPVVTTSPPNR